MMERMPALFLGHGSPMNAVEDNVFHRAWSDLAARIPRPNAILCVSAHWETPGVSVTAGTRPETIHDFFGFPKALFDIRYPAPGNPVLARRVADLLTPEPVTRDETRGLDHGVWGVLVALYPKADIPVVQLSLAIDRTGAFHLEIAKRLAPLRGEGVLIVGSGNIVHNLRLWGSRDARLMPVWARFDAAVKQRIDAEDYAAAANYMDLDPEAALAVPTPEHYLPMLYPLGVRQPGEPVRFFNDEESGPITMISFVVG